jgi:hypothetical protein
MQIEAGMTLGLLAWDKKDRATAVKRYQEAIDLAGSHPPFNSLGGKNLEYWISKDVQEIKDNLQIILMNDTLNATAVREEGGQGGELRKEVVNIPNTRIEANGEVQFQESVMIASDACAVCHKRAVKLQRCGKCLTVSCKCSLLVLAKFLTHSTDCDAACQKADWP